MKKTRCTLQFVLMAMFTFAGASLAHAQANDMVKADIPFDFYVGSHKMAAGTYFMSLHPDTHRVDVSSAGTGESVFVLGEPSGDKANNEAPRLEFDHVANDYFLKEIKTPEESIGFTVSKVEQQVAGTATSTTVVAGGSH